MAKPINLNDIFSLLEERPSQEKDHFLFLLGTDTVFTQLPTKGLPGLTEADQKCYERGETLSYSAQAIVQLLGEEAEMGAPKEPLSYTSPSVDVVNGPTTLGSEVGERVAQGVFLLLRAAASGKETLQIAAHSRGAVTALMVLSERARIIKALKETDLSIYQILCQAPTTEDNTGIARAITGNPAFKEANETPEQRKALLARLENLKLNPFLIDPVPGGSKYYLKFLRWSSPRFYERPQCDDYELLIKLHERTCCFSPVIPQGMQPLPIPGHHGSASGNRYNQQGVEVPESIAQRDTTTVQDLVLCKLFDFLNRCTGDRFSQENCHEVRLKHEQLDGVLNDFLNQNQSKRNEKLLTHYNAVLENIHAFIWFQEGSYARLGAQYAKDKQRFVHLHGHNHMPMEAAVPTLHQDFINQEHALLYLRGFVNFEKFENSLAGMIHATTETLKDTIARMFNSSKESSRASSSSFDGQGLLNLLQEEAGRKIFFNGLAVLIETLSQKYLRNNLSSEEDEALRNVIEEPFRIIQRVKEEIAKQADFPKEYELIINQFDDLIQTGFKHTIETHYASIIQQTDALKAQIEHLLNPPEHFYTVFHEFVIKLPEPDNDTPEELTQVKEYLLRIESSRIRSIEDIQKVLSESIASLGEVSEEKLEVIQAFISSKQSELLQPCFDIHQASDETYLINLERLYDLAKTLKKDYPAQQRLVSKEKIDIDLEQLNFRIDTLVKAGGILLKERTIDLRQKPDCVGEAFFNLIKQEAIKLGAPSPELEDLKREILKQEQLLDELKQQNTKLLEKEKAQQSVIENQESQMVRKAQDHLEKTRALEKQIGEIREQKEQEAQRFEHSSSAQQETISNLEDKIGKATEQNKALSQRLERLSGENSEEIRSLKETVQSQAEEIGRLVGQWVLLSSDTQKDKELIEKLQSQEEAEKIVLIQTKLLPFTNNYLTHLLQQAQKYQPELRLNPDGTLPELLQPLFESDKEVYDKIITKLGLVINLKSILQDTNERPLPSERVQAFGEALLRANDALKIHRDGPWTRFFKSSALVLGFAFELAYTVVTGKRNPLFFVTHTQGEAYVDDCAKELGLENPAVGA